MPLCVHCLTCRLPLGGGELGVRRVRVDLGESLRVAERRISFAKLGGLGLQGVERDIALGNRDARLHVLARICGGSLLSEARLVCGALDLRDFRIGGIAIDPGERLRFAERGIDCRFPLRSDPGGTGFSAEN
jgi:hypothetical protein